MSLGFKGQANMEMTITPSTIIPEILKKDNYKRWKILMRHYLEAQDLWDVVISNNIPSGVNEREWTKKNAAALLAIKISCEAKVFDKIEEMNSAKEVWDALADMHNPPFVSHEIPRPQEYVSHEISQPQEHVSLEMGSGHHHKDVSQETKSVEPRAGPETNLSGDQYVKLRDLITKGNDRGLDKFFEENPDARFAELENRSTALHFAITMGRQRIAERLISDAWKKPDVLEIQDNSNNTPLSLAIRYGMKNVICSLIDRNKNLLLQPAEASNGIPFQLACNAGQEQVARYLYSKTPTDDLEGDLRFRLLEECITKKMFVIAFDLLKRYPELAEQQKCASGSKPIILTLAQTTPPFFKGSQLIFWKRWIYKCTSVRADSIKQIKEERIRRDDYDYHPVLLILLAISCPWILLLIIMFRCGRIFLACVGKTSQIIQRSLVRAWKILQQSWACAWKIPEQSLACVRKVTHQLCDEFWGTLKGVLLGMLKMLGVLLWELMFMPFSIGSMTRDTETTGSDELEG